MNAPVAKTLMIFCEGAHDVAYICQTLKHCLGFTKQDRKFSDYPYPLNQLFKQTVVDHAAGDLSLDMAHKFFLPNATLWGNGQLVLVFNGGGQDNFDRIKHFFARFLILNQGSAFNTENVRLENRFLFVYDADSRGAQTVRTWLQAKLTSICYFDQQQECELSWQVDDWVVAVENPFAAHSGDDKAVYIWGKSPEMGTLEDVLHPLFEQDNEALYAHAAGYVDQAFTWKIAAQKAQTAVAEQAKRSKAIFTVMGQREKPGSSMAVMLEQAQWLTPETWQKDPAAQRFTRFVTQFMGI